MSTANEGGDQACTLECLKRDTLQQFEGPVKIIVVEPSAGDLFKRVVESGFLAFANLFIGAAVIVSLYFSYICRLPIFISAHIAACTVGFQLFLPSSFLMLSPYFGGSTQLKNKQRRSQHSYLGHLTITFGITGGLHILCHIHFRQFPFNPHTITGIITLVAAIPAFFIGPIIYYTDICSDKGSKTLKIVKYIHTASGVLCFVTSSLCFCTSFFKPSFQKWFLLMNLRESPWILCVCVGIYTTIIIRSINWKMKYHNTYTD